MAVGLIGVGTMGRAMLERLRASEREVIAYDVSAAGLEFARDHGASIAAGVDHVVRAAEIVILSLPGPDQVRGVVDAMTAGLLQDTPREGSMADALNPPAQPARGAIVVDTSTSDPQTSREVAAQLAEVGVGFVDAPVLGRPSAVGAWLLPAGGKSSDIEAVAPVLRAFASDVARVGDVGAGHAVKLLNQLMFSVINATTAEVMRLAPQVGVDARTFFETVAGSSAATVSGLFREVGATIVEGSFDSPAFTVDLLCKDSRLALAMAHDAGGRTPIASLVHTLNERAQAAGMGSLDTAALVQEGPR